MWDRLLRPDLAFRMLLDFRDAEDVVQEAFTRLARADIAGIADPEGWLVVVTGRLCLDKLRTRGPRQTGALDLGDDPSDPHALDPSGQVTLVDNCTLAMHALLERLSPAARTSFVLHDVFQYPFEEDALPDVVLLTLDGRPSCRHGLKRRAFSCSSKGARKPWSGRVGRPPDHASAHACSARHTTMVIREEPPQPQRSREGPWTSTSRLTPAGGNVAGRVYGRPA